MAQTKNVRLTPRLIEEIISEVSGPDCISLYKTLKAKKNISEFILAQDLDQEINIVRNMLYRLYHANLVTFTRKKDKIKGWYIYYWTFNPLQLPHLFLTLRQNRIIKLQERIDREQTSHFYHCPQRCMRLDFEQATDFFYKCPECGTLLELSDNLNTVRNLTEELQVLRKTPGRFK